ncbi:class I SAM-dependent methyltransferase [Alkaliphilus peptidifermentans]|uniref:Ubiquinone/menaquinone biosynthesis C-methylase UbiE n=1 Tax=Alkaliphilus peptidifermentans DSM 18978 TaxID=1120976 RepID=A0A1G5GYE7_9FIRM|nr:class I SAM-dependent methyltransferase [Alkaliphilus peptidifermentans]SCY56427.1 Ubiquinone/menaquinone biosynthesis C-methylase UbiE [Alkaliphilus peptidifermentans DSM 18978]
MKDKSETVYQRLTGKGIFPHHFAFTLLMPFRNIFLSPKKLIKRLELKVDSNVLEIGPGPGYFSVDVAKAIPCGRLYLFDIQKEMLDIAKKRLEKRKISNVEYHLSNGFEFPYKANHFDVIFMITVLGEIENKEEYVKEIHRVLRKNGTISISEQFGDPDKMTIDEINELFAKNDFELYKKYGSKNNFTVNYIKL